MANVNVGIEEIVYETSRFVPRPGVSPAICVGVYGLGLQPAFTPGGTPRREMIVCFELDQKIPSGELKGKPMRLSKRFSLSLHESASLMKAIVSWYGYDPTVAKGKNRRFDPKALVGKTCRLVISNSTKNGEIRAKIDSILPPDPNDPEMHTDFNPNEVPDWIVQIQRRSLDAPTTVPVAAAAPAASAPKATPAERQAEDATWEEIAAEPDAAEDEWEG